jgi:TRAP-type mannitol/chloroaromatic compound transport system permease small subunit
MLKILNTIVKCINRINSIAGYLVSWLTTLLVLVVCYDVFSRYLVGKSFVAIQELQWHIFAIIFLAGAGYTLKMDKHVRVDLFYSNLSNKGKAWINLLGTILFLIPFSLVIIWTSKDFVVNSFQIKEISPNPGGLPARYVLKGVIPVAFSLIFLQGISLAASSLLTIIGKPSIHS